MHDPRVIVDQLTGASPGGRDAVGRYLLGLADDPVYAEFSLEAKCYEPPIKGLTGNAVGVTEVSRLISRVSVLPLPKARSPGSGSHCPRCELAAVRAHTTVHAARQRLDLDRTGAQVPASQCCFLARHDTCRDAAIQTLLGGKRTRTGHRESDAPDLSLPICGMSFRGAQHGCKRHLRRY